MDALKLLSFGMILFFHFVVELEKFGMYSLDERYRFFRTPYMDFMAVSICIFFMASGAGHIMAYENRMDIKRFAVSIFTRILLPYYIAYVLYLGIVYLLSGTLPFAPGVKPGTIIWTLLGLDGYLINCGIMTFSLVGEWFLGAILILYLLFPLFRLLYIKCRWVLVLCVTALFLLLSYFYPFKAPQPHMNVLIKAFDFVMGMVVIGGCRKGLWHSPAGGGKAAPEGGKAAPGGVEAAPGGVKTEFKAHASGDSSFNSGLHAYGDSSFNSGLHAYGDSSFNSELEESSGPYKNSFFESILKKTGFEIRDFWVGPVVAGIGILIFLTLSFTLFLGNFPYNIKESLSAICIFTAAMQGEELLRKSKGLCKFIASLTPWIYEVFVIHHVVIGFSLYYMLIHGASPFDRKGALAFVLICMAVIILFSAAIRLLTRSCCTFFRRYKASG